jgi:hypothetical protein
MPFTDRPLPEALELPRLREPRPRDKRLDNLRHLGRTKGGLVGYCHHLAERHPKAYCGLLGKLLPFNLNANVASATVNEVRIISVPADEAIEGTLVGVAYHRPDRPRPHRLCGYLRAH